MDSPVIRHWIVSVAQRAQLDGAVDLVLASDTPIERAWETTARAAGITTDALAQRVADHYRLPVADLESADPQAFRLVPAGIARKLHVLPLRYSDRSLTVATADPVSMEAEHELAHLSGRSMHFEVAPPEALARILDGTYPAGGEGRGEIPPLAREAQGGPRVLVVDDDPATRLLLRTTLEEGGFRVAEAADGIEALEMLHGSEPFDLVTLDLYMERMQGFEVLRQIRGHLSTAAVPVVVATGSDDAEVEMKLFEAGADDFVVKPVDPPRFLLRVQAVLRRRASASLGGLL